MNKAASDHISEGLGLEGRKAQISFGRMQSVVEGIHEGLPIEKAKMVALFLKMNLTLKISHSFDMLKLEYIGQLVISVFHLFITNNFNGTTSN